MNVSTLSSTPVWRASVMLALVTLLGFGLLYSLAGAGLGRVLFPHQATGSLIEHDGQVIGSSLVAQPFADDRYFQSRPSAARYDVMALAGSNQARTNPDLRARIDEARAAVAAREGVAPADVPGDLVTQSGGGIDPHLSPEAIRIQIVRVARVRGLSVSEVERLVAQHTEGRQFGVLGAPRVNVLELNLALDAFGTPE
ncbi:potassium-transporting ATPase subunit KdpC [Pseudoxanthomonas sp. PXM02]|uniref:potassium-transporting ATPase subunit KdpC n=1 Tax=Pseudoxanthomonas sp. PXM02 TaxID=2769294 RepID=UPI00177B297A|nr:potassium-transporting ATPase subunit KdpC [Pseudoxanthomonas sp. PXM02]MBD9479242.1 potassium-transporting ATPase subunit KdpC [Pseudoxanthomonas sp. PXM02]